MKEHASSFNASVIKKVFYFPVWVLSFFLLRILKCSSCQQANDMLTEHDLAENDDGKARETYQLNYYA